MISSGKIEKYLIETIMLGSVRKEQRQDKSCRRVNGIDFHRTRRISISKLTRTLCDVKERGIDASISFR